MYLSWTSYYSQTQSTPSNWNLQAMMYFLVYVILISSGLSAVAHMCVTYVFHAQLHCEYYALASGITLIYSKLLVTIPCMLILEGIVKGTFTRAFCWHCLTWSRVLEVLLIITCACYGPKVFVMIYPWVQKNQILYWIYPALIW
jgi:hypothetical protein